MKVLDASILLYAYDTRSPFHERARVLVEDLFSGRERVGLTWLAIAAFIRISTHPSLKSNRFSREEALTLVDGWLTLPQVMLLIATDQHWIHFRQMISAGHAHGNLVTDAEVAALTMEWGGTLLSPDRDFSRFAGLKWVNPLA